MDDSRRKADRGPRAKHASGRRASAYRWRRVRERSNGFKEEKLKMENESKNWRVVGQGVEQKLRCKVATVLDPKITYTLGSRSGAFDGPMDVIVTYTRDELFEAAKSGDLDAIRRRNFFEENRELLSVETRKGHSPHVVGQMHVEGQELVITWPEIFGLGTLRLTLHALRRAG